MWRKTTSLLLLMSTGFLLLLFGPAPSGQPQARPHQEAAHQAAIEPTMAPVAAPDARTPPSTAPDTTATGPDQVPVLLYHHLVPAADGRNSAIISIDEFKEQMAWLSKHGYTAIRVEDLDAWLKGEAPLPPRPVLITFDDGYRSTYEHAYPILRHYGMRAAIFMITSLTGRTGTLSYLTAGQMQAMENSGLIEIQAHTHDGHWTIDGQPKLIAWSPEEIRADLARLRRAFADMGLPEPTAFAYPYGAYDDEVLRALEAESIALGFTVKRGYVRRGDPPLELKRLIILPGTSVCRFAELVTGNDDPTCETE